jgi:hypothetical protein
VGEYQASVLHEGLYFGECPRRQDGRLTPGIGLSHKIVIQDTVIQDITGTASTSLPGTCVSTCQSSSVTAQHQGDSTKDRLEIG